MRPMRPGAVGALAVVGAVALVAVTSLAQGGNQAGSDWANHQGDPGGTRYSTLSQINTTNVKSLTRAWTFRTNSGRFASSPMVVDGIMYFSAPNGVYAIDGATGVQIWKYAPESATPPPAPVATPPGRGAGGAGAAAAGEPAAGGRRGGRGGGGDSAGTATRGPAYWPGSAGVAPRIFSSTTPGLAALDAKTGALVMTFGENGVLPGIRSNSPPVIYKNLLITKGPTEPGKGGTVKAFDIVSGQPRWTFYLKAQPGDPNRSTWLNGSADTNATPDFWGMFSVDDERGTVFVPVEKVQGNGNNDYWGGGTPAATCTATRSSPSTQRRAG